MDKTHWIQFFKYVLSILRAFSDCKALLMNSSIDILHYELCIDKYFIFIMGYGDSNSNNVCGSRYNLRYIIYHPDKLSLGDGGEPMVVAFKCESCRLSTRLHHRRRCIESVSEGGSKALIQSFIEITAIGHTIHASPSTMRNRYPISQFTRVMFHSDTAQHHSMVCLIYS